MNTIRYGSRGTDVELLQLALARAGFSSGEIDGIFGSQTLNAVRRFQSANRLTADGIVGPATWAALRPLLVGYTTATVRGGDTFYRLARNYGSTISAITAANPSEDPMRLQIGAKIIIPYGFDLVPTGVHYTSELLSLISEGLIKRYPFIRHESIGDSVMGTPIRAFEVGTGDAQVFYNAAHHANEWITTPLLLKFLESYMKAYTTNGTIFGRSAGELFRKTRLFLVPMVNPDGVDLVNQAIDTDSGYYKNARRIALNYSSIPFPNGWKANIDGTDLNLNYPAGWDNAREIKYAQGYTSPAPRDFVGTAPLSAPESLAVYRYTLNHNFNLILAYHTQGKVIFWKYQDIEPPGGYDIGVALAQVSGYTLNDVPEDSSYAGYKDWFILNYVRPGYTIEAGTGVNPLPLSQFGSIYNDNIGILTLSLVEASKLSE